jgi:hypothetical protein
VVAVTWAPWEERSEHGGVGTGMGSKAVEEGEVVVPFIGPSGEANGWGGVGSLANGATSMAHLFCEENVTG